MWLFTHMEFTNCPQWTLGLIVHMHIYIKEYQKEHTFTIPFASKNIILACNRLFSPLKSTISKPLAWDYEHGDSILSTWFSILNTIGIKTWNCGLKLWVQAFEYFYNLKFEPVQFQIYEPHECEQPTAFKYK
jgi:hypothetical protein